LTAEYIPSQMTYDTLWVKVSRTCILMSVPPLLSIGWLTLVARERERITDMYTFRLGMKYPIIVNLPMIRACSEGKLMTFDYPTSYCLHSPLAPLFF
jgi:hypothetical protein